MDDAIVKMANQFSLESSRNSTSAITIGRPHPVELVIFAKCAVRTIRPFKSVQI